MKNLVTGERSLRLPPRRLIGQLDTDAAAAATGWDWNPQPRWVYPE